MRILVHEFASGGGFAGRALPASLVREGRAMLNALLEDVAAIEGHEIVTTADRRLELRAPKGVEVVTVDPGAAALPDELMSSVDAVWLIAPETGRCLERLAARVERAGKRLLGTGSAAIRRVSDKQRLPRRLARCGVPHPPTRVLGRRGDARAIADRLGYPIVVKPSLGAGCWGVSLARNARELDRAISAARASFSGPRYRDPQRIALLQSYVRGVPASVSLLCDGRRAVGLSVNAQAVRAGSSFSYRGGATPLDHPLSERAIDAAIRACEAVPGLRGYVGVDLILSRGEAVVIEINPRLTTAYLGVRLAIDGHNCGGNIAAMALEACRGRLSTRPRLACRVRFNCSGRITYV